MSKGIDFSYSPPDLACVAAGGNEFVVRYIGDGSSEKHIDRAEVDDIRNHELNLVLVYQRDKTFMLGGAGAGRIAVQEAVAARARLGLPENVPIYFACDTDMTTTSESNWSAVQNFLLEVSNAIPANQVGVYGGLATIERLVPNFAHYGWQTRAWSTRSGVLTWSNKAHIRQTVVDVAYCGGTVDHDVSVVEDYGQYPRLEDDMDISELDDRARSARGITDTRALFVALREETLVGRENAVAARAQATQANAKIDTVTQSVSALTAAVNSLSLKVAQLETQQTPDAEAFARAVSAKLAQILAS